MDKQMARKSTKPFYQYTEFTLGVIIVVLFLIASIFTKNFSTAYNISNLLKQGAITGVLAVAQTLVIITGGIDISCGSIAGFSCMVLAIMQRDGSDFWLSLLVALGIGLVCGIANGAIIYDLKVPAMIATLGTQTIIRGIVKIISNALTVNGLDPRTTALGVSKVGPVPTLAVIWIVIAVIAFLLLRYTIFGRNLYVVGSSTEVAKLSGINVRRMNYMVYGLGGLLCGLAGVMLAARVNSALPSGGTGYEMDAIAAAVIGGASLAGGRGAIAGTVLGTILMTLISNAGVQFEINTFVLEITSGVLIILAVALDMLRTRRH